MLQLNLIISQRTMATPLLQQIAHGQTGLAQEVSLLEISTTNALGMLEQLTAALKGGCADRDDRALQDLALTTATELRKANCSSSQLHEHMERLLHLVHAALAVPSDPGHILQIVTASADLAARAKHATEAAASTMATFKQAYAALVSESQHEGQQGQMPMQDNQEQQQQHEHETAGDGIHAGIPIVVKQEAAGMAAEQLLRQAFAAGFGVPNKQQEEYFHLANQPFDLRELEDYHAKYLKPHVATRTTDHTTRWEWCYCCHGHQLT